ncbi:hypothetical protein CRG98_021684 [Punica granatum]|uniref:Uncharacterized protein n=1 Tax=Punica granatum TaxID=22663 RepID=A0A2I0JNS2_PUNGR|nr:hypothetical protein CRG98_021684 [Punica granatum]
MGSNVPHTLNAPNPSAEWDLTSSYHYARSTAYVEGDLDRMCSQLDITRELDRPNGYSKNQSILLSPVGPIGPDPRLLSPRCFNLFIGHSKHTDTRARAYATQLGSVHLPGDAHVKRSRHLPFYDPKVEVRQVTRV